MRSEVKCLALPASRSLETDAISGVLLQTRPIKNRKNIIPADGEKHLGLVQNINDSDFFMKLFLWLFTNSPWRDFSNAKRLNHGNKIKV